MYLLELRPLRIVLALGSLGLLAGACEPAELTRSDFCARWAEAACTEEVVSVCQATTVEDCRYSQRQQCDDDLPSDLVNRGVDECIAAVADAYEDADLTAAELEIVARYGAPCNEIFLAGEGGGACESDSDCEPALRCVFKDEAEGQCQDPVIVEPGLRCTAPEEMCEEGFFCDGSNCIAALDEGDDCQNHVQCGGELYCDEVCLEKLSVGDDCTKDAECSTGICYGPDGEMTCANRLRLSPAEPMCDSLR
jgi:hypothetical protein